MAVTHFRQLPAHRAAVVALYRELLRSTNVLRTTRLSAEGSRSSELQAASKEIRQLVVGEFRRYKPSMSPWACREKLAQGHDLYVRLNELRGAADHAWVAIECSAVLGALRHAKLLKDQMNRMSKMPRWQKTVPHNVTPSASFKEQHALAQSFKSKVRGYIRSKEKCRMPENSVDLDDPGHQEYLEKALYKEARRKMNKIKGVLGTRGPYQVRVVYRPINRTNMYYFLRLPWPQSRRVASIFRKARDHLYVFSMYRTSPPEYLRWARMEGAWEHMLLGSADATTKKRCVSSWTAEYYREAKKAMKRTQYYLRLMSRGERNIRDSLLQFRQRQLNKRHEGKVARFRKMEEYIREHAIGPHSEPSLPEVLKMFRF